MTEVTVRDERVSLAKELKEKGIIVPNSASVETMREMVVNATIDQALFGDAFEAEY